VKGTTFGGGQAPGPQVSGQQLEFWGRDGRSDKEHRMKSAYGGSSAGAGAAVAAAAQEAAAIKASGAIVEVRSEVFLDLVNRQEAPLIISAEAGFFRTQYRYLMSYRGLIFFVRSPEPLSLLTHCEVLGAESIWVPA
jgi:hypothetical protein